MSPGERSNRAFLTGGVGFPRWTACAREAYRGSGSRSSRGLRRFQKKTGDPMPKFAGVIGAGALALFAAGGASAQAERLTLGVFPGLDAAESFEILDRYMPLPQDLQAKRGAVAMLVPGSVPGAAIQRMIESGK